MAGTDSRKMSSSWGNTIDLTLEPNNMFGKVMSISDDLIVKYFTLVTRVPMDDIIGIESQIKSGANPRDIKAKLANEIVKMFYGEKKAKTASDNFDKQFKDNEIPDDIKEVKIENKKWDIIELLFETKLVSSKSDAKRMVKQGAVKIDDKKIISISEIEVKSGMIIQVGKRKFVKIS